MLKHVCDWAQGQCGSTTAWETTKDTKRTQGERELEFDALSNRVIGCAIEEHGHLGPRVH